MWWAGYKVHLTESCDQDAPRLITHVETSRAGNGDVDVTPIIHQALKKKDVLPKEHLTDTNYAEAKQFVQSRRDYGIELIAPTRADHKWQAQEQQGFDAASFQIDWEAQKMICPAGQESSSWTPAVDRRDKKAHQSQVLGDRLSMLFGENAMHDRFTTGHFHSYQRAPSGVTSRQSKAKG